MILGSSDRLSDNCSTIPDIFRAWALNFGHLTGHFMGPVTACDRLFWQKLVNLPDRNFFRQFWNFENHQFWIWLWVEFFRNFLKCSGTFRNALSRDGMSHDFIITWSKSGMVPKMHYAELSILTLTFRS